MRTDFDTLKAAKEAAANLHTQERALREKHAGLLKERSKTDTAYAPLDAVIANMSRIVDEAAAEFADAAGGRVVRSFSGYVEARSTVDSSPRHVRPHMPNFGDGSLDCATLVGLAPDIVRARLATIIKAAKVPFGLAPEARGRKLAELDRSIEEVERNHTSLVESSLEFGITLRLLDSVRERKEAEARKVQLSA